MDNQLLIHIKNEHYMKAHDYLLNCPLSLALKEYYPKAYTSVGAKNVIIILDPDKDDKGAIYEIDDNYDCKDVERRIKLSKEGTIVTSTIVLNKTGIQDNYFLHPPKEDHVNHPDLVLPDDLFT